MEQLMRDMRIATIYEGTTGIQSLDLLGRKVMGSGGQLLRKFTKRIHKFCEAHSNNEEMSELCRALAEANARWGEITMQIGEKAMENPDEIGAASVDYAMFSGYVTLAFMWAQMAELSLRKLKAGDGDKAFYESKLATARFYFRRILPRTLGHAEAALAGADCVMELEEAALHA